MDIKKLQDIFKDEPKYRLAQAKQLIFQDLIADWDEALTLPKELREKLKNEFPLTIKAKNFFSKDKKTIKALVELSDGKKIEAVLMKHEKRNTVCVSSQIGCPLGCAFCATGKMGFQRNLKPFEIVNQVLFFDRLLKSEKEKVKNVVFMGMGEPFLNFDNVREAVDVMQDPKGLNIGSRRISVSTVGITEGIQKLKEEKNQLNLAISLHAPNDEIRSKIMPVNRKYPIQKVLKAVDEYIEATSRKVMFEYIMIDGVNDSDECAKELARILKKPLYFVNLIACNPTGNFQPSSKERIQKFKNILMKNGIQAIERFRFGQDIHAACGQLAGKK